MSSPTHDFGSLCQSLGKDRAYVKNLQRALKLKSESAYSEAYLNFLRKIIALKTMGISQDDISDLFEMEKKMLKLLHVDSLSGSETWFLDAGSAESDDALLITGFKIGLPDGSGVQDNLDFGAKEEEMFKGVEMGEDVRRILDAYDELKCALVEKVKREIPVVKNSLMMMEKMAGRRKK